MSQSARITLGVAVLVLAAGFMALVPFMKDVSPQAGPGMAICGLFCGLIAVACLSRASQPVTIRLIGAIVFFLSAIYLTSQILAFRSFSEELGRAKVKSRPSIMSSLGFMVIVGLPSGYAAIKGRYPGWGKLASAFGADESIKMPGSRGRRT
jgi:hypothetical protein